MYNNNGGKRKRLLDNWFMKSFGVYQETYEVGHTVNYHHTPLVPCWSIFIIESTSSPLTSPNKRPRVSVFPSFSTISQESSRCTLSFGSERVFLTFFEGEGDVVKWRWWTREKLWRVLFVSFCDLSSSSRLSRRVYVPHF